MPKRTFLSSLLAYCFLLAIGSGNISALLAQGYTLSVQELSSGGIAPSQLAKINQQVQYSITLSFSAQQVEEILAQRPTQITVELPSVLPLQRTIVLSAFEIFTPDAKSYVGTVTGDKEISFRNEWASYRGHLQGDDRSVVVMNFSKQGVDAMFSLSNAQYFIRPIAGEQSTMERPSMFFSSAAEKGTTPFRCGLRDEKAAAAMEAIIQDIQSRNFGAESQKGKTAGQRLNFNPAPTSNLFGPAISTDTIEVRVALEGDYTFFQLMGTAQAATNLMTSAVTYASAIYLRDVNVKLVIPFTRVWDTPNDPYSNTDIFTTLNEFVNYWRLNMGTVDRTTAHLFTSPTGWMSSFGVAGIARLNTLCNPEEAYAVTSVKLPNGTEHLMTFAHELGHNFGAYHTHSCLWPNGPIDFCSAVEGGCYSGPTVNQEGTIMSYCGTRRAEFGAIVSSLMRRTVETSWCAPSVPSMAVAQSDSVFIESLFSATGGTAWLNKTNWQSGRVPGRYGVAVRSGRVVSIDLPANNLIGTLPQGLENLTALRKLNLSGKNYHHDMQVQPHSQSLERFNANRISGQIPTNIGQLTALEFLDLSNNLLNGTIPSQLSALQQLRWLNLSENFDLGGTIPSSLGSLLNLELLDLYRVGRLTGSIPPQLGSATQLRVLILSEDRSLTGSIPTELASIPKLRLLKLDNCALTGTIPTGLANVTTLEQIVLSNNKLTGSIPADIGNLLALNTLSLDLNQLTGTIPASIVNLTKLSWLDLSDNQLTGSIPAGIGNIDLMHLGLGNNKLTGQIPVTLGKLSSLLDFIISGNQLTGTIPDTLRNLGKNAVSDFGGLLMFRVGDNQLTGPVPSWLSQLSTVSQLDIGGNLLDAQNAPIPDWILNRSGWVILHLHNLQYTGAFPTQLMTKTSLQSLKLSGNKFTGSIPTTIGNLSGLSTLWLSNNQLTGSIPFQLGNAQGMRDLRLNNNQFSGALPAEIGNMRNLQYGYFDFNQFSGAVPIEFEQLGSMVQLALNDNDLTSVPDLTRLALLHSDPTSFLSVENNRLTFTTLSTIVGFNTQAPLVKFTYAPQKSYGTAQTISLAPRTSTTLTAGADDTGNTYQWLRNGVAITGATASSYVISNASTADTGQYIVNVKNASVPLLTLQRAPYRVTLTSIPVADVPTLVFPATGATNVLETISLKWNRALDATAYTIQFGTDSLFTTTIVNDSTITDTLKQVGPLSFQTKYFWRVKARNTTGSSNYSLMFSFTVGKAVPFAPALLQPANGSINQSLSPTLRWAKATRGQTYRVQVSSDPQFLSFIVNDSTLTDTLRQIGPLVNNLTVYWRVQSTNTDGTGPFSDVYSFTTSKLLPAGVTLIAPPDNATGVSVNATCVWTASSQAEKYTFQLSTDAAFNTVFINDTTLTITQKALSGLSSGTKYYWRVNARNSAGSSGFSTGRNFTTAGNPTSVSDLGGEIPTVFRLDQNYPNPFNPSTTIRFGLPKASSVRVSLYTILGQRIATLVDNDLSAGTYTIRWDAAGFTSGMYLYRMEAGTFRETKKLFLLK